MIIFNCNFPTEARDCLSTLTADSSGKLDILWHNGDTLGVNGAKVGILEEPHEVSLRGFLESSNSGRLETKIGLEILGNLTNETLERKFADEKFGRLLVTTDLTESDGTGPVPVRFLHTSGGGR